MRNYCRYENVEIDERNILVYKLLFKISAKKEFKANELETLNFSFNAICENPQKAAGFFYNRLLELDDHFAHLLSVDLKKFTLEYVNTMSLCMLEIQNLNQNNVFLNPIKEWIQNQHFTKNEFDTIGSAFIDTIAFAMGNKFNIQMLRTWTKAYKHIVSTISQSHYL